MFLDVAPAWADHGPPVPVAPSGIMPAVPPPPFDAHGFGVHWSTVIGIVALAALYLWGMREVRRRSGGAMRVPTPRVLAFFAGLVVFFFSLNGPLHELSDTYLFSAHMIQHLLLSQAVAPLLAAGVCAALIAPLTRYARMHALAHRLTRPWTSFGIYTAVFVLWHVPLMFNTMMAHHGVHITMHLSLLAVSVLSWWPIVGDPEAFPTPGPLMKILLAFLLSVPMMVVAAFITYAGHLLYPWYSAAPRVWGMSPLEDQTTGGVIMWVPGTAAYWIAIMMVWFRWARREGADRETEALTIPEAPALPGTHGGR